MGSDTLSKLLEKIDKYRDLIDEWKIQEGKGVTWGPNVDRETMMNGRGVDQT